MPRLRRAANGFQAAGDQLLNFALQRMAQKQAREEAAAQQQALAQEQSRLRTAEDESRTSNDAYLKGLENPVIGRQRAKAGLARPDENPTDARLSGPVLEGIAKADSLTKLMPGELVKEQLRSAGVPVDTEWTKQVPATGPGLMDSVARETLATLPDQYSNVLGALGAKREALVAEASVPDRMVEAWLPDGSKRQLPVNLRTMDPEGIVTGPTTQQTIDITNTTEKGTRGEKVRTAGAEAGARAAATNAAELAQLQDPRWLQGQIDLTTKRATARALAQRNAAHAAMVNEAGTAIASITPDWEKMKILSSVVNTGAMAQPFTYYGASKLQTNKDAAELDQLNQNFAKRLANNPIFGGNKGAQSEADSQAIAGRLPNSYDSKESARRKILDWETNMYTGFKAIAELPQDAPPQQKINIMRRSVGLPEIDLGNPPGPIGQLPQDLSDRWDVFTGTGMAPITPVPTHKR